MASGRAVRRKLKNPAFSPEAWDHNAASTLAQVASDQVLRPLGPFATPETERQYPPTLAGRFVQAELEAIRLKAR